MTPLIQNAARKIAAKIKEVEDKLLNGRFRTLEEARGYVEHRFGLIEARDLMLDQAKLDNDPED